MGADIHSFAEVKQFGKWQKVNEPMFSDGSEPFSNRSYNVFGFLADVRNYSHCPVITELKDLPEDSEYLNSVSPYAYDRNPINGEEIPIHERETNKNNVLNNYNYHSHSWLTLKELLDFDYEKTFEDRRSGRWITPQFYNGAYEVNDGYGKIVTFKEHLGNSFFKDLETLKALGKPEDVRIVFWFDN